MISSSRLLIPVVAVFLAVSVPPAVRADSPVGDPYVMPLAARFTAPGEPGFVSQYDLQRGMPWTFAGLTAGAWESRDPFVTAAGTGPGVLEAAAPLAWADSSAITFGEGSGWRGFGATLAVAETFVKPVGRKPRAVFTLMNGGGSLDRYSLFIERGDDRSWVRGGTTGEKRGALGALDLEGAHLWFLSAGTRRGAHTFEARMSQQGMGAQLASAPTLDGTAGGFGEGAHGIAGSAGWTWRGDGTLLSARLARGVDGRDSHGAEGSFYSRRDAWRDALELVGERRAADWTYGARIAVDRSHVVRWGAVTSDAYTRTQWDAQSQWAALRTQGTLAGGRLNASLGGGHLDAPARSAERFQIAPSLAWTRGVGAWNVRLHTQRVVDPLWSDLSDGTPAFVQDVWSEGVDVSLAQPGEAASGTLVNSPLGAGVMALQTGGRATSIRYPLRDFVLRNGWRRAGSDLAMLLGTAHARGHWRALGADASGWALSRPHTRDEAAVDPVVGGRAGLETRFRVFANDLGVRLRLEAAYVGSRDADPDAGGFAGRLPGYTTLSGTASLTLGDATIVLRGEQLEGTRHAEVWTDPVGGSSLPALGPGRSIRAEVTWPLFD